MSDQIYYKTLKLKIERLRPSELNIQKSPGV